MHINVSNKKCDFKRLLGSRDQASMKTRLTQKLPWKALKRLLKKTEIDESIIECMLSV